MKLFGLIIALLFLFTGCGQVKENKDENLDIITSSYATYIFTKNITKDIPNISVANMSDNHEGCLHDYHLETRDMKRIEDSDILVINGAGFESFLEKVYEDKDLVVIDSSENIELLTDKFSDDPNEHTWLSITNAISQVEKIGNELIKIDSENESKYFENMTKYVEKLKSLRNELRETLYDAKQEIRIVTTHDAFPYFAEDFGIDIVDVIEREEGESPTQKEMGTIIENIKDSGVIGIFMEPNYSEKLATTIAKEGNVKVYVLDSITSGEGNLDDYENKMRENINVLKESMK